MSILIKDMEMPQNCDECRFQSESKLYCDAMPYNFCGNTDDIERPDWCPLVEVPPHGRLIDADALHDAMYHRAFETDGDTMWQSGCWVRYRAIEQVHESQPTVIEAEESNE